LKDINMKNYVQPGKTISVTAPYAVVSGQGVLVGAIFGIAAHDAAISTPVEIDTEGVFDVAKDTATPFAQGAVAFWDDATKKLVAVDAVNKRVGMVMEAALAAATTVRIKLVAVID
jgi:predicted RecA/RadA family phage recombinase